MHRLFQIAHRRILTKLKGSNKEGIKQSQSAAGNQSSNSDLSNLSPKAIQEHVKDFFTQKNSQIKSDYFALNHTTDIYHTFPKDQLKNYWKVPCPIQKSFTGKKDSQNAKPQKNTETISEIDQLIILNAKKLRSVLNVVEEKVCGQCPFKQSCKFSTTRFEDLTLSEKQYQKYQSALSLTPLQSFIFHNQKMYQLSLLPETAFESHFGFRVWAAGYKIMDNLSALLRNLSEGGIQTKQFLQIRKKYILQVRQQQEQGLREKKQTQFPKNKKSSKKLKSQEKQGNEFLEFQDRDILNKLQEEDDRLQAQQRKRGRNIPKKVPKNQQSEELEDDIQDDFVSKSPRKVNNENKQFNRKSQGAPRIIQDSSKVKNPFTMKWSEEQEQNVFRNMKNELQMQDFENKQSKRESKRHEGQPRQQRQFRQPRQQRQFRQHRQPRQQSQYRQQRYPRQNRQQRYPRQNRQQRFSRNNRQQRYPRQNRQTRQNSQYTNRGYNDRNGRSQDDKFEQPRYRNRTAGDFERSQPNQYVKRNFDRKDSYENSNIQKLGDQLRGNQRGSEGFEKKRDFQPRQYPRRSRNHDKDDESSNYPQKNSPKKYK